MVKINGDLLDESTSVHQLSTEPVSSAASLIIALLPLRGREDSDERLCLQSLVLAGPPSKTMARCAALPRQFGDAFLINRNQRSSSGGWEFLFGPVVRIPSNGGNTGCHRGGKQLSISTKRYPSGRQGFSLFNWVIFHENKSISTLGLHYSQLKFLFSRQTEEKSRSCQLSMSFINIFIVKVTVIKPF